MSGCTPSGFLASLPLRQAIMGMSFSAPSSGVTNYHQLSALDIDKQNVDFKTLDGKVGGAPRPGGARVGH